MTRTLARPRRHPRDRCGGERGDTCERYRAPGMRERLDPYAGAFDSAALAALDDALRSPATAATAADRVERMKVAVCHLEPDAADHVRDVFETRRHLGGERFGRLSTRSRCELLALLDERAVYTSIGEVEAPPRGELRAELTRRIEEEEARRAAEEARFQRDLELHRKAGAPGLFAALMPAHARHTLRPYAHRIHHPVLRAAGTTAERARSVSLVTAVMEPIARPIATILELIDCFFSGAVDAGGRSLADAYRRDPLAALRFPSVFSAGAAKGLADEAIETVEGVLELITDPGEIVAALDAVLAILWSPASMEIACDLGRDLAELFRAHVAGLARRGADAISFELGRVAGPAIVWTLIAAVAPHVVAGIKGVQLLRRLGRWIHVLADKIPWLRRLLRRHDVDPDADRPKALPVAKDPPELDFPEELLAALPRPTGAAWGEVMNRLGRVTGQDRRAALFHRLIDRMKEVQPSWEAVPMRTTDGSYFWQGLRFPNTLAIDRQGRVFQGTTSDAFSVLDEPGVAPLYRARVPHYDRMELKVP